MAESKLLDCQFGPKYFKQKPIKGKKEVKSFILYPEFNISKSERDGLTKWKLRKLQEDRIQMIREDLQLNKPIKKVNKYFISIPGENLHSGHLTGTTGVFSQKLNPEVSLKILDMVQSGITDVKEIKCSLKYYVNTSLCKKLKSIRVYFAPAEIAITFRITESISKILGPERSPWSWRSFDINY